MRRTLAHVASAYALGLVTAAVGVPLLVASLFGGAVAGLVALAVLVAVACALAVALDRVVGPRDPDRTGSVLRGTAVGLVGTGGAAVLGGVVAGAGLHHTVPQALLYAAAGLPFAAVAGLQWPGTVRRVTAVLVVAGLAAAVVPPAVRAADRARDEQVRAEIGTLARPWLTEVAGLRGSPPQDTGTDLLVTPYTVDGTDLTLRLFRTGTADTAGLEPCAVLALPTPATATGSPVRSCTTVGDDGGLRTTDVEQELVARRDDGWIGVTAPLDAPRDLLDQVLEGARPMDDGEYDDWLDTRLPHAAP